MTHLEVDVLVTTRTIATLLAERWDVKGDSQWVESLPRTLNFLSQQSQVHLSTSTVQFDEDPAKPLSLSARMTRRDEIDVDRTNRMREPTGVGRTDRMPLVEVGSSIKLLMVPVVMTNLFVILKKLSSWFNRDHSTHNPHPICQVGQRLDRLQHQHGMATIPAYHVTIAFAQLGFSPFLF
jgi:hypothetical protein